MNTWAEVNEYLANPLMPQWAVVVVAAIGLVYAYKAFRATKKQADESTRQANAAEKMLQVIQRPNVFCSEIQIIHLVADERPAVIVHFINQGGTPALSVKLSAGLEFVTDQK